MIGDDETVAMEGMTFDPHARPDRSRRQS
jgi:hypothetical protein